MAHWKQTRYNEYTLVFGKSVLRFKDYKSLYNFCIENDAIQS